MIERLNERLCHYPGAAGHDATGLGDVVSHFLTQPVEDIILVGRPRQDIFSEYIVAIEHGEVVSPRIATMYNAHKYCTNHDLYGGGHTAHPPDEVVAGAIAWHMRHQIPRGEYGPEAHGTRVMAQAGLR